MIGSVSSEVLVFSSTVLLLVMGALKKLDPELVVLELFILIFASICTVDCGCDEL